MVNKWVETPSNNSSDCDEDFIEEMCATMDDLCHQNQSLEDNVLHI